MSKRNYRIVIVATCTLFSSLVLGIDEAKHAIQNAAYPLVQLDLAKNAFDNLYPKEQAQLAEWLLSESCAMPLEHRLTALDHVMIKWNSYRCRYTKPLMAKLASMSWMQVPDGKNWLRNLENLYPRYLEQFEAPMIFIATDDLPEWNDVENLFTEQ